MAGKNSVSVLEELDPFLDRLSKSTDEMMAPNWYPGEGRYSVFYHEQSHSHRRNDDSDE